MTPTKRDDGLPDGTRRRDDGLPDETRVGCVALDVAAVDEAAAFYRDVVGLRVLDDAGDATTLGVDGTPLLVLRRDEDAPARPADAAGLFHTAFRFPTRSALGDALARVREHSTLDGASDHLVSEALYLTDPEGNGVELYWDRPRDEWPRSSDGRPRLDTLPLDLADLAAAGERADAGGDAAAGSDAAAVDSGAGAADSDAAATGSGATAPEGTDVGHVHLEVTSLPAAREFYVDALGLDVVVDAGSALFVAAGGYHHHVGLNTWGRRSAPAAGRGLAWFELVVPGDDALGATRDRLEAGDWDVSDTDDGFAAVDPDGITVRVRAAV